MTELDIIRRFFMSGLSLVNKAGMIDAQIARLASVVGISLEIPEQPGAEITLAIRDHILEARKQFPEEMEWLCLNGPRDQLCVRYGISRNQISGVLASATKREQNGNGNGNGGSHKEETTPAPTSTTTSPSTPVTRPSAVPRPSPRLSRPRTPPTVTSDTSSPRSRLSPHPRAAETRETTAVTPASFAGVTANPHTWPLRMKRSGRYPTDDMDRHIARLVIESGSWDQHRDQLAETRSLTKMQVAGLKAAYTSARTGKK